MKKLKGRECFMKEQQLCWTCKKVFTEEAVKCSWIYLSEPVQGWVAEPTVHDIVDGENKESYLIKQCPLYEKYTHKRIKDN